MKRAYIEVSYEQLHQLLHLPDDVDIFTVESAPNCGPIVYVYINSTTNTQIPETPEAAPAPKVQLELEYCGNDEWKGNFV